MRGGKGRKQIAETDTGIFRAGLKMDSEHSRTRLNVIIQEKQNAPLGHGRAIVPC
jgi:hypothetical protein